MEDSKKAGAGAAPIKEEIAVIINSMTLDELTKLAKFMGLFFMMDNPDREEVVYRIIKTGKRLDQERLERACVGVKS